ncbi:MAG: HTH domain-containing protein [Bacteroidales bacterium]|nr:HTH domain-containing protein [Bacteroidales bacterium]
MENHQGLIKNNKGITTGILAKHLKVTRRTIARDIENLKIAGKVRRIGSDKSGYWEIINDD